MRNTLRAHGGGDPQIRQEMFNIGLDFVDKVALYLCASDILVIFGSSCRLLHEIRCNSKIRLRTIGKSYESSDIFWAFVGMAEYEYVFV